MQLIRRATLSAALLMGGWLAASLRAAEPMQSETNAVARSAMSGGAGESGSVNIRMIFALGEEIISSTAPVSATRRLGAGLSQVMHFPGVITDLAGSSEVGMSSVTLTWSSPGYDGGEGALQSGTTYFVRVASFTVPDTFSNHRLANISFSTSATLPGAFVSTAAAGLLPNTTYWTRLWTIDAAGNLSYASSISTFVTLALPVELQDESFVSVHFTSVTAQWAARPTLAQDVSSMTAAGYRLEASSTNFGALVPGGVISSSETNAVALSTLTVSDPGLIVDKPYFFRVAALNWAGMPNWTVLGSTDTKFQVQDPLPADPPYTDISTGSMTARWDRNGNPSDTLYHAEVSPDSDFSGIVTATDTYELFYSTGGLAVNSTYYFRVYATTRSVSSGFAALGSTMTWVFAPAAAAAPFTSVHESSLTVRWLHNGNPIGVSTYSVVATTEPFFPNSAEGNELLSSTRPAGADPMASFGGLTANTTYFLFASGVNSVGAQGDFVMLGSTPTRPAPASAAVFDEIAYSSAVVSWSIAGNPLGVTTFTAVLSTAASVPAGGGWDVSMSTVPDASPVVLSFDGLRLNATYHLFITAVGHGHSAFVAGPSTATRAAAPGASPDEFDYDPVAVTGFTLNWSSGAADPGYNALPPWTTYYAQISVNPAFSPVAATSTTFNLSAGFSGLSVNTTYYARVAAFAHHHGAWTAFTDFGSAATLTQAPLTAATTFTAVAFTSMTVSWLSNGNPANITTYTVVLSPQTPYPNADPGNVVLSTAPAGAAPTATLEGLNSATTYYFFVSAVNHRGVESAYASLGSTRTLVSPKTWVGGVDSDWNTAGNWSPSGVPLPTDAVTIAISASVGVSAAGPAISFSSLTLGSPSGATSAGLTVSTTLASAGSVLIYKNSGLTQATTHQLLFSGDFTMVSGSSLTHTAESATSISSVNVRVAGTFDLQAGATITVVGKGYRGGPVDTPGFGPGGGGSNTGNVNKGGGGGGYGGAGGAGAVDPAGTSGPTYGSLSAPINMGSGGGGAGNTGVGGAGGGVVIIDANRMIFDGVILSSGDAGQRVTTANPAAGGGGSGGGVYIAAVEFSGSGSVDVQGAPGGADTNGGGNGGGGGGGRASIFISGSGTTCGITALTGGGAAGGTGAVAGDPGTYNIFDSLTAAENFAGAALSPTSLMWTWSLTTGATDYQIFSSTGGPMSPSLGAADNYTTTGLAVNTTASFYIQARACGANLADSSAAEAATLAAVPAAAGGAVFTGIHMSSMSVQWSANGNPVHVTSYTVVLSTEPAFPNAHEGNVSLSTAPAGSEPAATVASLDPNTTYFVFVAAENHAGFSTAYADLSTAAATKALPPEALGEAFLMVGLASATANWAAFAPPPQASSASAQGYILEASSTNFGALSPGGAVYSSATGNVELSTLTITVPAPSHLCTPHYFRAASLNWAGLRSYTILGSTNAPEDYGIVVSTQNLDIGSVLLNTEVVISTSLLLSNPGCPVTYQLKVATITPGSPWTVSTTSGTDAFTVQALFSSVMPASEDFEDIDKLTDVPAASTPAKFAADQNGAAVPVGEGRLVWFKLGMPRVTTSENSVEIRVTVYAVPPL